LDAALAAAATIVAVAFGAATLERWLLRRRPHELAWTISLGMFAAASFALWLSEAVGWSAGSFRVFFLFGAVLNVPWLALGTVYLLAPRRVADTTLWVLAVTSGFAAGVILVAPMHGAVPRDELPQGSELFGPLPRVLAAVGSGLGAVVVIGGALWSAWRLFAARRPTTGRERAGARARRRLAAGNLVIAAGTIILSLSGTVAGRLGKDRAFALTLVLGITVLFAGFLIATPARPPAAARLLRSAQDAA
jgi:zinc transporter ZupT